MSNPLTIFFDISASDYVSSNMRLHWGEKARRTRSLRELARYKGRQIMRGHARPYYARPVHVTATLHTRSNRRIDPANAYPTVKALIDGLTDAGLWADDDARHLIGPDMRLGNNTERIKLTGMKLLTLTISEDPEK